MKRKGIEIVDPKKFAKGYFDYDIIKNLGIDVSKVMPQDECCFFLINSISTTRRYINFPKEVFKTTFYSLIFLTRGYCKVTDNLHEFFQKQNQIRIIVPGKSTSIIELSEDIEGFHCLFDKEFIETFSGRSRILDALPFLNLDAFPLIELPASTADFFEALLSKLYNDYNEDYHNLKESISLYLIGMLKECEHHYKNNISQVQLLASSDRIAADFLSMINEYYLSKRSLTDYAQLLNITPKHLTKSVKKATGKTPSELITDKLVLEAKVLLKNTSLSVSEIAYQLNFEDPTYFNRFFKKQTSQTPSLFRKMA